MVNSVVGICRLTYCSLFKQTPVMISDHKLEDTMKALKNLKQPGTVFLMVMISCLTQTHTLQTGSYHDTLKSYVQAPSK